MIIYKSMIMMLIFGSLIAGYFVRQKINAPDQPLILTGNEVFNRDFGWC